MDGKGAILQFGSFTLDLRAKSLVRNGSPVSLPEKTVAVLATLATNAGRVVERGEILETVWPDSFVSDENISHHIYVLRKILGDGQREGSGGEPCIKTIKGRGYRFLLTVVEAQANAAQPLGIPDFRDTDGGGTSLRPGGTTRAGHFEGHRPVSAVAELEFTQPSSQPADILPNYLPKYLTSLIGRESEIRSAEALVLRKGVRLLTVTGPPGCGKTRLAAALAVHLVDSFPDGVYFVPLAPITEPDRVASTIAQVLNVREAGEGSVTDLLKVHLRGKASLVILDNLEHLLAASPLLSDLLFACGRLRILVTSRAVLGIQGEQEFHLSPLATPEPSNSYDVGVVTESPAVKLFIERAQSVKPEFELTGENADQIAQICIKLDGLPLAIELAASQIRLFHPEHIVARLGSRMALLRTAAPDRPDRQKTIRDAIAWSYDLLTEDEQKLFRRLSVFVGGCNLSAVLAICGPAEGQEPSVLDGLSSLVEKSLVFQRPHSMRPGDCRLGMLETIREFAVQQLALSGEEESIRTGHSHFFCELVETTEENMKGAGLKAGVDLLGEEIDNLRTAMSWSTEGGEAELGLRIASALRRFWARGGSPREGAVWLDRLLSRREGISEGVLAKALAAAGWLARIQGNYQESVAWLEEGIRIAGHPVAAPILADLQRVLAGTFLRLGQWDKARALLDGTISITKKSGDAWALATLYNDLGAAAQGQRKYAESLAYLQNSLDMYRKLGDESGVAIALNNMGLSSLLSGDVCGAGAAFREAILRANGAGNHEQIVDCVESIAVFAASLGEMRNAVVLLGAANARREAAGLSISEVQQKENYSSLRKASAALSPAEFEAAWTEGRVLAIDQAVTCAIEITTQGPPLALRGPEANGPLRAANDGA
jgi:predicted ATPase/DNA-binding winged helix-turn-helix (wHTH) protein